MNNRIDASVYFSYKGESHAPRVTLDLDSLFASGESPDIYLLLAKENNIGLYSYELEVMQSHPVSYSNAQGLAADFLNGDEFDSEGFTHALKLETVVVQLEALAREHLGLERLDEQPGLKAAMLAAYEIGLHTDSQE